MTCALVFFRYYYLPLLIIIYTQRNAGVPFVIIEKAEGGEPLTFSGAQPADAIAEMLLEAVE